MPAEPPPTMKDLGLPGLLRRRQSSGHLFESKGSTPASSQNDMPALSSQGSGMHLMGSVWNDGAAGTRTSILDFEHLFVQYFVEGVAVAAVSAGGPPAAALPDARDVAEEWKAAVRDLIWEHRGHCQERWPQLRLSRRALARQLDAEVVWHDELQRPSSRVTLTLEPERICHRLLWALGDALPPTRLMVEGQARLRKRWPQCRIRCADNIMEPSGVLRTMFVIATALLALCLRAVWLAAAAAHSEHSQLRSGRRRDGALPGGPGYEELLDRLAARLLVAGSMGQLWILHAVAAAFPLRSLHSPFRRDIGCLAAYSPIALWLCRVGGPLAALSAVMAAVVRFVRLGLFASSWLGLHTAVIALAAMMPLLAGVAAFSVRSSLYSHHHLFMVLFFVLQLCTALGFAAYFEMVKWAVFGAAVIVILAFYLFSRYATEFTSVNLLRAAQLQWTCAHLIPVLGLILAAALEVESGAARMLVDFICTNQDLMPKKMCVRMLTS